MDPDNVSAVIDWPVPKDRKRLQKFLGFANFYIKFKNYSSIASPLHALTSSKTKIICSEATGLTFEKLKRLFSSAPILHAPNPDKPFIVEVGASSGSGPQPA